MGLLFYRSGNIGLICFSFGPMLFSLGISFTSWDVISAKEFVGLENYKNLFQDPLFFKSLKVTLYYTLLSVPLITCIPLLIAMLLNSKVKGISVFRAIFYVPSIVPIVASAAVWMYIYNPMYGLLNSMLKMPWGCTHRTSFSVRQALFLPWQLWLYGGPETLW